MNQELNQNNGEMSNNGQPNNYIQNLNTMSNENTGVNREKNPQMNNIYNTNNKNEQKKNKTGLIVGIIAIVVIIVLGIIFGSKLLNNNNNNNVDDSGKKILTTPPSDYISINSVEDYAKLLDGTYDLSKNYILMNDLDLKDYCTNNSCKPIGGEKNFTGIFDGNNHTISNYSFTSNDLVSDGIGFFGRAYGATIKNLIMKNAVITLSSSTKDYRRIGVLIGEGTDINIENCDINGTIKTDGTLDKRIENVGILAGKINTSNDGKVILEEKFPFDKDENYKVLSYVKNCNTSGLIELNNTGETNYIGGFIGSSSSSFHDKYWYNVLVYINKSIANVDIKIPRVTNEFSIHFVGGFMGSADTNYIYQCGSEGSVSVPNGNSIAGFISRTGITEISECYSTSKVLGGTMTAGFISYFNDDIGATQQKLTDSYFAGEVTIDTDNQNTIPESGSINSCMCASFIYKVDAIVSNAYSSAGINYLNRSETTGKPFVADTSYNLANTYYDSNLLDYSNHNAVSNALTTDQMKLKTSYPSFDFDNVWTIDESKSTPILKWQKK